MKDIGKMMDDGFIDEVGGTHCGGVGLNPNGVFCGECTKLLCKGCMMEGVTKDEYKITKN